MRKSRDELDSMLDELERDLAMLVLNEADHDDLWAAFAGQADAIEASAGGEDLAHVKARMDAILRAQGIQPSN
ncbi:MAG TPA: hypothetical protein VGH80_13980 [Xanthomonadaceae bacterium]|jgi:hypothetical protein